MQDRLNSLPPHSRERSKIIEDISPYLSTQQLKNQLRISPVTLFRYRATKASQLLFKKQRNSRISDEQRSLALTFIEGKLVTPSGRDYAILQFTEDFLYKEYKTYCEAQKKNQ